MKRHKSPRPSTGRVSATVGTALCGALVSMSACAFDGQSPSETEERAEQAPGFPGGGADGVTGLANGSMTCFYEAGGDRDMPVATIETAIESIETTVSTDTVHVRVTMSPDFCDNTYGANAIGWPAKKGHTFEHLVKSDRIDVDLTSADASEVIQPTLDYISESADAPSGYACLGVDGGEGEMRSGDRDDILAASSSLDRNLNERGYAGFLVDSPATDEGYTPSVEAPNWDYRMVYEVWVALDAFGGSGFGDATIDYVHCSPAKTPENTVVVEPDPCPPDWCNDPDGCDGGPSTCNDPDGCEQDPPTCTDPDGCDNDYGSCSEDLECPDGSTCFEGDCIPIID